MTEQTAEWIGKTIVWTHGANTLTGIATSFDADDNEFYLPVDGLVHAHVWVPAGECRIERQVPTVEESPVADTSSGEHRRVRLSEGDDLPVCDTCTNILGLNVRWDHAVLRHEREGIQIGAAS